ncbi:GNAT family N-acetyltransferase [Flavobacterium sp.]|uniref:GNAT family N-acetyltransferase n=1 Tax=Flavobacterium sp. TaxID=239 RepID=UPI0012154E76|nr:GNAT family N-acetyltransferase [Flavobacterium sp.]RZJ69387.1 MAG: N-acetyltransferase [Flavobacterium sp.]
MEKIEVVLDEKRKGKIELLSDGKHAGEMVISENDDAITVYHTEVSEAFAGRNFAKLLLDALVGRARDSNRKINPLCPYVFAQFKRHPDEFADVWKK